MRGDKGSDHREKMVERLSQSCTLLEDTTAIVHGIKIFGSPWYVSFTVNMVTMVTNDYYGYNDYQSISNTDLLPLFPGNPSLGVGPTT